MMRSIDDTASVLSARHLNGAEAVRLVPEGRTYSPRGRSSLVEASRLTARHVGQASATAAIAGSTVTAIALMLGLGR